MKMASSIKKTEPPSPFAGLHHSSTSSNWVSVVISPAGLDFHAARLDSSAAQAMLVGVYPATLALAPVCRMMEPVADLMGQTDMPTRVLRSESSDLSRTTAVN
jgi:hypothetical protein